MNGKSITACRLRMGGEGFGRDAITFAEGRSHTMSNAVNEILSVNDDEGEPVLSPMMGGVGFGGRNLDFDIEKMSPDQAAEYLWRRFTSHLER